MMTKMTLNKSVEKSSTNIEYKINHINSLLVIFLLLFNLFNYNIPISFNTIFLVVYYICTIIIIILLLIAIYYDIKLVWLKYGK